MKPRPSWQSDEEYLADADERQPNIEGAPIEQISQSEWK